MWTPQLGAFDGWRVIAPAFPGFDGSDAWPDPSVETYARQAIGLLDALGVDRPVVCGLSMGGYVTFALLRQAPGRPAGVMLADTRATADAPEARPSRERMIQLAMNDGPPAVAADFLPKLFGPTTLGQRPAVVADVRRMIESQRAEVIADAVRVLMTRPDSRAQLPALRVPTLVVVGEEDSLTPPADAEAMHAAMGERSTLVRIPGVGHMSNVEDPKAFNGAVSRFLDRV
jgi:pimeloyl-ACP methyl ester carboxylesterase